MNAFSIGSRKYVVSKGEVCRSALIDLTVPRSTDEMLKIHHCNCWGCRHYSGTVAGGCGGYARMQIKTFKQSTTKQKGEK
jgi:hypothetical protein